MVTAKQIYDLLCSEIKAYEKNEAAEIAFMWIQHTYGLDRTGLLLDEQPRDSSSCSSFLRRINSGEPIQYILGEAFFRDRRFKVSPAVLIPRPETEELVEFAKKTENLRTILDLGTGSGCIAVSLALECLNAKVFALDISEEALVIASENAQANGAQVIFLKGNMLHPLKGLPTNQFDLIISNPPYVLEREKQAMRPNVLRHEPHLALFVSDNDPLTFYEAIGKQGLQLLAPGGSIWVEINSDLGEETALVFRNQGYSFVKIHKDFFEKERFLEIKK